jgi:crotonobetainyl-CoA:carnitine CoA-transferase CaiB-like acyl-CoA transferase
VRIGEVRAEERAGWGKPLEGVRVLALEQMQALPYGTQLMAHLGADVVKVEHPERGDSGRGAQPRITDADGREVGATFLRNNLNKRSIGIDLKQEAGVALVKQMLPRFDVVAENFTPGVMDRLGLGYADVSAQEPGIVYASISGFGNLTPSPYRTWPAYAPIAEAMGGIYDPNRKPGEPPPVVVAGALGDNASALFLVIGILGALRQRERTGRGQHVDVSMYDAMIAMADMVPNLWSLGAPAEWATAGHTAIAAAFAASDGYFVVTVFREHHFERLARTVGHPEWIDDPRFATREGWARCIEPVLRPAIEAWARDKTKLEAAGALCEQGIASGPSNVAEDLRADPHVEAHDMLIEVPLPHGQPDMLVHGNPIKMSHMAEGPVQSFPGLGQHTDELLQELLDLTPEQITTLRQSQTIK